jgi:gamma-glutamyltranspeptidase/glutathione hydrolase
MKEDAFINPATGASLQFQEARVSGISVGVRALAFADCNRYVGDETPRALLHRLLSQRFARERACQIDPAQALTKPVSPGDPDGSHDQCPIAAPALVLTNERGTTHLTVADRWGNVVANTLTIEQIGGNAMLVPDRGFLRNNELTDFNFTPTQGAAPDPNLPAPGKRPRSSMAPTILLAHGKPFLAIGSAGGSTIITTRVPDPHQPDRLRHDAA